MAQPCDTLFETLLSLIDKPYDRDHLLAKLLCRILSGQLITPIDVVDGVPMFYDPNRDKNLSFARPIVEAGAHGLNITNRYLKMEDVPSAGEQGFLLPRKATITGMWAKSRSIGNWSLEVRRNGVLLSMANVSIVNGEGSNSNIDIDLNAGDVLQIFAVGTAIAHPIAKVEIAWRD